MNTKENRETSALTNSFIFDKDQQRERRRRRTTEKQEEYHQLWRRDRTKHKHSFVSLFLPLILTILSYSLIGIKDIQTYIQRPSIRLNQLLTVYSKGIEKTEKFT